jgi:hypothetical protein
MKREQIITIMKKGFEEMAFREASKREMSYFKESADAYLALPLDVPNSDEILSLAKKKGYYGNVPDAEINAFLKGALAVIIEIIKRNK